MATLGSSSTQAPKKYQWMTRFNGCGGALVSSNAVLSPRGSPTDGSRRRRGRDVDSPLRRVAARLRRG